MPGHPTPGEPPRVGSTWAEEDQRADAWRRMCCLPGARETETPAPGLRASATYPHR